METHHDTNELGRMQCQLRRASYVPQVRKIAFKALVPGLNTHTIGAEEERIWSSRSE